MPKPHKLIKCGPGGKKCSCCCPPPGDRARRYLFKQAQRRDEELALEEGMQEFSLEEVDWPKVESPTFVLANSSEVTIEELIPDKNSGGPLRFKVQEE